MNPTTFESPFGPLHLLRRPLVHDKSLRAWDAADEYLLHTLQTLQKNCTNGADAFHNALVVNDQFGALAIALHVYRVTSWSDSRTAHLALAENSARNNLPAHFLPQLLPSTEQPSGPYQIVLWRIPKTLALLAEQLAALSRAVDKDSLVLAGGMLKHLPEKLYEALSEVAGVEVLPALKKARVYRLSFEGGAPRAGAPVEPHANAFSALAIHEHGLLLRAGANVFARDKFDIGARFFIEQFAQLPPCRRIADLGCGNGILGMLAKRRQPDAEVEFFDDSYQAVAAAAANYRSNGFDAISPAARFHIDDAFSHYEGAPFDLILCNPPFHQGHVVGDQIAREMFRQSLRGLRRGGELWIVGNRHLHYSQTLKHLFGNCRQIAANSKFVVLAARA